VRHQDRIERFIHVSTSEVYGNALSGAMDEDHPLNPMSPYASAKCGADRLVFSYWSTYGIPAVIVRPFNNFGPRQHLEKAVPRFITSCLLGEPITIHGDGSAARDWIFVEDHCDALEAIMDADLSEVAGEVFNLGTGEHRTIGEVASLVRAAIPAAADLQFEYLNDRPGQVSRHTCDASKARRVLGWSPKTSFEEGMDRTIAWYRDNSDWWDAMRWMRHIPIVTSDGKREMH
jgi:dTDP-glucose 4,6-dehydratase